MSLQENTSDTIELTCRPNTIMNPYQVSTATLI